MKRGIYHGMPNAEYHRAAGLSNTGIGSLRQSPHHYWARHLDPARPVAEETTAQLDGTLAHCAILEPDEFDKRYRVGPDVSRATKAWKEAEADAARDGMQLIKPEQYDRALRQAAAVRMIPDVAEALASGRPEVSAFWIDEETEVLCKCRPDWVHETAGGVILLDIKTYSDASPREFERQASRMAYHRQDAWYCDGYAAASGMPVLAFIFVAVEMGWPHAASAAMFDDDSRAAGRAQCREALTVYAECLRNRAWPSYPNHIELITVRPWAA